MRFFLFIIILAGIVGCTSTSTVQNGTYKYLYDYESREMHPEYILYHHGDDSSTVYFRVRSRELLYARSGAQTPFVAKINIRTTITNAEGTFSDTTYYEVTDPQKPRQGWLMGSYKMKMGQGIWNILVEFTDLTKNLTQPSYIYGDKTTSTSAQNYLLTKYETGEPLFGGFATSGQQVEINSARNKSKGQPVLLNIVGDPKLPPPPFSNNGPEIPTLTGAHETALRTEEGGSNSFEVNSGSYFITHDAFRTSGFTLKTANTFYPEVKEIEALEWPLRYITTKTEHEEIVKNNYPKMMIDNFWLECAGNKEHARELIKVYYHRVEEANYYFSSYTEGWRTDRGMIHLIFGNPTKINKYEGSETWQYGEDGSAGMLAFVFRKMESPLSNNIYILDRDPGFKQFWEKMVQTWRNGRVYND